MTKKWDKQKERILRLYKEQNKPLHEVREIMKNAGFDASVRAYRSRFDKWGINKYNCQRRRNWSATQVTSFELPSPGMMMAGGSPGYGTGAMQLPPLTRYSSAPDLSMTGYAEAVGRCNADDAENQSSDTTKDPVTRPFQEIYLSNELDYHPKVEPISPTSPKYDSSHIGYSYYPSTSFTGDRSDQAPRRTPDDNSCALHSVLSGGDTYYASPGKSQAELIASLIEISARSGSLDDRDTRTGLTPLQLCIRSFNSSSPLNGDFWEVSAALVRAGADTRDVIPDRLADEICTSVRLKQNSPAYLGRLQQQCGSLTDYPLWVVTWLSACKQVSRNAVEEHLAVLQPLVGGDQMAAVRDVLFVASLSSP